MEKEFVLELIEKFKLGKLISEPKPISGGITNSIFKIETDEKIYALKIINSNKIKNNKNHFEVIEASEEIASIVHKNGINAVGAIKINNKYVNQYKNQYFLLYEWVEGTILKSSEIKIAHLKLVAQSLALIHKIKINNENTCIYSEINFDDYYKLLKNNDEEWAIYFKNNFKILKRIYNIILKKIIFLYQFKSYVHKDLNRKNIIWTQNIPYIIDWETATVGNPYVDFFSMAWFLSDDVNEEKYKTITNEYFKIIEKPKNINDFIYLGILEEITWLEFSLKRALKISGTDKEEIELGKNSIITSMTEIFNYYEKIPLMIKLINKI